MVGELKKDREVCSIVVGALLQETHPRGGPAETQHGPGTEMSATEETNEETWPRTVDELESELETHFRIVEEWQIVWNREGTT